MPLLTTVVTGLVSSRLCAVGRYMTHSSTVEATPVLSTRLVDYLPRIAFEPIVRTVPRNVTRLATVVAGLLARTTTTGSSASTTAATTEGTFLAFAFGRRRRRRRLGWFLVRRFGHLPSAACLLYGIMQWMINKSNIPTTQGEVSQGFCRGGTGVLRSVIYRFNGQVGRLRALGTVGHA
jgi:hypothetical protein